MTVVSNGISYSRYLDLLFIFYIVSNDKYHQCRQKRRRAFRTTAGYAVALFIVDLLYCIVFVQYSGGVMIIIGQIKIRAKKVFFLCYGGTDS